MLHSILLGLTPLVLAPIPQDPAPQDRIPETPPDLGTELPEVGVDPALRLWAGRGVEAPDQPFRRSSSRVEKTRRFAPVGSAGSLTATRCPVSSLIAVRGMEDNHVLGMLLGGEAADEKDDRGVPLGGDTLLVLLNGGERPSRFTLPPAPGPRGWIEVLNTTEARRLMLTGHRKIRIAGIDYYYVFHFIFSVLPTTGWPLFVAMKNSQDLFLSVMARTTGLDLIFLRDFTLGATIVPAFLAFLPFVFLPFAYLAGAALPLALT